MIVQSAATVRAGTSSDGVKRGLIGVYQFVKQFMIILVAN